MFQQVVQAAISSLETLWFNKVRSVITMVGIVIGVSSVLIIMSIGSGAQTLILSQVEGLGANLVNISPGVPAGDDPFSALLSSFGATTLNYDDFLHLRNNRGAPNVVGVSAYSKGFAAVKWRSRVYDTALTGTTASYLNVEDRIVEKGRFFTEEEERGFSRVVVLGKTVEDQLFGESDALGQRVSVGNTSFEVIGILKKKGVAGLEDYDDQIFLPIKTSQRIMNISHVGLIRAKVDLQENVERSMVDINVLLRERHKIRDASGESDDFSVSRSTQSLGIIKSITDGLRYFLAAMAALSLLVGGIGIMNIMLISVTERTREIGLRKAVGANDTHILGHFLLESIFVTGIGGIIGIIIGVAVSFLISVGVRFAGFEWAFIVSPLSIFLALGVSACIGLFFGYYPARKASKLNPIEALQYE